MSPVGRAVRLVPPRLPEFLHHGRPKGYILARLEDQAQRRAKYGNTVFNQEPDIKNGVGASGTTRTRSGWPREARHHPDGRARRQGHLNPRRGERVQPRVRLPPAGPHELHFESVRPTDILNLDAQPGSP